MFLSIIVPCYNAGSAITSLLHVIAAQLSDDCELVLVNDGSTDDTSARIQAFIAQEAHGRQILLKETSNAGAARARATGLELARGAFVFFCDSDDLIGADFITHVRKQLALHPHMDLMFFSSNMVADGDDRLVPIASKVAYAQAREFAQGGALLTHHLRQGMYTAAVWTFVARRMLIVESGAAFTDRTAHEDHLFTLKLIMSARSIVAIPEVLYRQKVRMGSLTNSTKNALYIIERIAAYQEADRFLRTVDAPRRLYGKWSFHAILSLMKDNRKLVPAVLGSGAGARFVSTHLFDLLKWYGRAGARRLVGR